MLFGDLLDNAYVCYHVYFFYATVVKKRFQMYLYIFFGGLLLDQPFASREEQVVHKLVEHELEEKVLVLVSLRPPRGGTRFTPGGRTI